MTDQSEEVILRKEGSVGRIILNRPEALNALSYDMVLKIKKSLYGWIDDVDISLVLIEAVGEKAFCAGGDIAELYNSGVEGDYDFGRSYWRAEYELNALIAHYPKYYVALMDGIVMGGGVGLSAHGSHRIVTERTMMALPECSIGLVPDVGSSCILASSPGRLGEYIGLTGIRLNASDIIYAGFANIYIPSNDIEALKSELIKTGNVDAIKAFAKIPDRSELIDIQNEINEIFDGSDISEIISNLGTTTATWSDKAQQQILRGAPLSLAVTLELIRQARTDNGISNALMREYRFVSRSMECGEFIEGVRAAIIDKDRNPAWRYPELTELPLETLEAMLSAAPDGDFEFNFKLI